MWNARTSLSECRCDRLTRLTNAFSKKWENLWAAYCLHFAYYNFCRIHKTLRVTPAMESNLTDHVWDLTELRWYSRITLLVWTLRELISQTL
jgi:hypothetical protein